MDLNLPEKRTFVGPAHVWKRILAFVIDLLILDFFVFALYKGIIAELVGRDTGFFAVYSLLQSNPGLISIFKGILALVVLFALAYFVLMEYLTGQTPGKILMHIHVVSDKADGKEFTSASFGQCLLRSMFLIPVIPFILFWVIDPLYLFIAKNNQRFTEWLSRTRVVEQFSF